MSGLLDTADRSPYAFFEQVRAQGGVVWDASVGGWLVVDHALCKLVEGDEAHFTNPYVGAPPTIVAIKGGMGNITLTHGAAHDRLRRFHLKLLTPAAVEQYRRDIVVPVVAACVGAIKGGGRAELFAELAAKVPPAVTLGLLGLDWRDDALVARVLALHDDIMAFIGRNYAPELERSALDASAAINAILLPAIRARRTGDGTDFISRIWREAPSDEVIDEQTVLGICREIFLGGSDTTVYGIANCLYVLLTDADARAKLQADRSHLRAFVDETMRLYGSVQYRYRIAAEASEVGGVAVAAGDKLVLVNAAANRDPAKYGCPAHFDLDRRPVTDHLAFNWGERSCVGAGLARAEMRECLLAVLDRLPDVRLDPEREPPRLQGLFMRAFKPLNARFA